MDFNMQPQVSVGGGPYVPSARRETTFLVGGNPFHRGMLILSKHQKHSYSPGYLDSLRPNSLTLDESYHWI